MLADGVPVAVAEAVADGVAVPVAGGVAVPVAEWPTGDPAGPAAGDELLLVLELQAAMAAAAPRPSTAIRRPALRPRDWMFISSCFPGAE